jgi:hypothetical protein
MPINVCAQGPKYLCDYCRQPAVYARDTHREDTYLCDDAGCALEYVHDTFDQLTQDEQDGIDTSPQEPPWTEPLDSLTYFNGGG